MKRPVHRILALLILSALIAPALAATGSAQTQPPSRNFLWKATKDGGQIYLAGSVHLLAKDYYPLSPALESAFHDADLLVEELDLGEMTGDSQLQFLQRSMLPADQSLDKVLSPDTYTLISRQFTSLGVPIELFKRFKPWAITLALLQLQWSKAGFDSQLGLDKHFYDRAKAEQKPVKGLETIDFQLSRFDGLAMPQQDQLLVQTLKDLSTEAANVRRLGDAWKTGDVATVEQLVLDDATRSPELHERFLVERNRNWMPTIESLFVRPGRALVVVGAAHLVGPNGLVRLLQAKGYTVEQL